MAQKRRTTRTKASRPSKTSSRSPSTRQKTVKKERTVKLEKIKAHLITRRAEIGQGMEQSLDYSDAPPLTRGDSSDLAADALDSDTTLQLAESGSRELSQIEEALRKIDDGTYGQCEVCAGDIPATRLEALPYATMCVRCKEQQEREGGDYAGGAWGAVEEIEDLETQE
jgi:DnaK suppressor protein